VFEIFLSKLAGGCLITGGGAFLKENQPMHCIVFVWLAGGWQEVQHNKKAKSINYWLRFFALRFLSCYIIGTLGKGLVNRFEPAQAVQ